MAPPPDSTVLRGRGGRGASGEVHIGVHVILVIPLRQVDFEQFKQAVGNGNKFAALLKAKMHNLKRTGNTVTVVMGTVICFYSTRPGWPF